jgi:hypothetical protein
MRACHGAEDGWQERAAGQQPLRLAVSSNHSGLKLWEFCKAVWLRVALRLYRFVNFAQGEDRIMRACHGAEDGWQERAAAQQPFGRLIDPQVWSRLIWMIR